MDQKISALLNLVTGDHVILISDDWDESGNAVVVDAEPVPGSTQCIIKTGGEMRFVSRTELRLAA